MKHLFMLFGVCLLLGVLVFTFISSAQATKSVSSNTQTAHGRINLDRGLLCLIDLTCLREDASNNPKVGGKVAWWHPWDIIRPKEICQMAGYDENCKPPGYIYYT